ncbi:hypothetical protein NEFER03_2172 [Nematocida sp. LUAm3]|nr:hypothetical protein NEFER03_2172 [Nematocida sp. LUAm3]
MQKMRRLNSISIAFCDLILFLLFFLAYMAHCTHVPKSQKERKIQHVNFSPDIHPIICNTAAKEKRHKSLSCSKSTTTGHKYSKKHVFYIMVCAKIDNVSILDQDRNVYSVLDAERLCALFDKITKEKKLIWMIFTGKSIFSIYNLFENKEVPGLLQKICTKGHIVLQYMNENQYNFFENCSDNPFVYMNRHIDLCIILKYMISNKTKGISSLVLYNILSPNTHYNKNTDRFIYFMVSLFLSNYHKFDTSHVITHILEDYMEIDEGTRNMIKPIGVYAHPVYICILEYLKSSQSGGSSNFYVCNPNPSTSQTAQDPTERLTPAKSTPISFIFSNSQFIVKELFPFNIVLDIAFLLNYKMILEPNIESVTIFTVTKNSPKERDDMPFITYYPESQIELSFNAFIGLNDNDLNVIFLQLSSFIIIRNVVFDSVFTDLKKKLVKYPLFYHNLPKTKEELNKSILKHKDSMVGDIVLKQMYSELDKKGKIYYINQFVAIVCSDTQPNICTKHKGYELVDILLFKEEIAILKPKPNQKKGLKRELIQNTQDEDESSLAKKSNINISV